MKITLWTNTEGAVCLALQQNPSGGVNPCRQPDGHGDSSPGAPCPCGWSLLQVFSDLEHAETKPDGTVLLYTQALEERLRDPDPRILDAVCSAFKAHLDLVGSSLPRGPYSTLIVPLKDHVRIRVRQLLAAHSLVHLSAEGQVELAGNWDADLRGSGTVGAYRVALQVALDLGLVGRGS